MRDIEKYREVLNELAEKGSEEFINNSSIDHAAVMIETLFNHADGDVRILTDHLAPIIYDRPDVKKAVDNFLQREKSEIHVIMLFNQKDKEDRLISIKPEENNFIQSLKEHRAKIKLFKAKNDKLKDSENHFMVLRTIKGNYAFRLETNIIDHIATGSFNSENIGKPLCTFFERKIDKSTVEIENAWQS